MMISSIAAGLQPACAIVNCTGRQPITCAIPHSFRYAADR